MGQAAPGPYSNGDEEKEAVSAFGALGIKMVHRELKYRSFLRRLA